MRDSVLIIAHGDPDSEEEAADMQAERLSAMLDLPVHVAYLYSDRGMADALGDIAAEEPERIVVLPFFMTPGMFTERIVPAQFGLPQGTVEGTYGLRGKSVRISIAPSFGTDPRISDVVEDLIRLTASIDDPTVLLIGHGSDDHTNSRTVGIAADGLRRRGYAVFAGSNDMEHPDVQEALALALDSGADEIVAVPMFVSGSWHTRVQIPRKMGMDPDEGVMFAEHAGRTVAVRYTGEIGLEEGVADIFASQCRALGAGSPTTD